MDLPVFYLQPGNLFIDPKPHLVTTVLGSCVAVCLWDARRGFGGMTHSVLPAPLPGDIASLRHTGVSITRLADAMAAHGSAHRDLRAKLFGGASILVSGLGGFAIGPANVRMALASLKRLSIPVVAQDVRGDTGLVIRMDTGCGDVWLRRIAGPAAA